MAIEDRRKGFLNPDLETMAPEEREIDLFKKLEKYSKQLTAIPGPIRENSRPWGPGRTRSVL